MYADCRRVEITSEDAERGRERQKRKKNGKKCIRRERESVQRDMHAFRMAYVDRMQQLNQS